MSHPSPEIRILTEVPAALGPDLVMLQACARAASQAGADALRADPAGRAAEATPESWIELRKSVLRMDLDLVVTVQTEEEVALFRRVGVGGLAVSTSAGEGIWDAVGSSHVPAFLLSDEHGDPNLEAAVAAVARFDVEVTVLFGSAERPTPAEGLGLARCTSARWGTRVRTGFADRSGTGWGALAACALGADAVELAVTLSPYLPGGEGALPPEHLGQTVKGLRYLAWARAHHGCG